MAWSPMLVVKAFLEYSYRTVERKLQGEGAKRQAKRQAEHFPIEG
jgi:hypothetical protein